LEKLILPTRTTKLSLWALQQDKSFFQKSKSPMFDLLSKELELTAEQTERIQERRYIIHDWVHVLIEFIRYETISVLCFCILPFVPLFFCVAFLLNNL
jgi:hypothetical protein